MATPSELELHELAALVRSRRRTLSTVMVLVLALSTYGLSWLLLTRSIAGGVLPLFSGGWRQTWDSVWSTWIATTDGYPGGVTPLLDILALPAALGRLVGLKTSALISALVLLAVPLTALGVWFVAGTVTQKVMLQAWMALVWAPSPSLLLALSQGHLGTLLVYLALPQALLALVRAVGADRCSLVLSELVGTHPLTDEERAELDRFSTERVTDLAHLDEEAQVEPKTKDTEDTEDTDDATATEDAVDVVHAVHVMDIEGDTVGDAELAQDGEADTTPVREDVSDDEDHNRGEDEAETGPAVCAPAAHESEIDLPPMEKYGYESATAAAVTELLSSVIVTTVPATAAVLAVIILLLSVTT